MKTWTNERDYETYSRFKAIFPYEIIYIVNIAEACLNSFYRVPIQDVPEP